MGTLTLGVVENRTITDEDGILHCECMGLAEGVVYAPCKHVFAAMRSGLDCEHELGGLVFVPMYEEEVDGRHLVIESNIHHAERKGSMLPFYVRDERVGWLDEGEARWSMRLVLFEWLRSQYLDVSYCSSKMHSNYFLSTTEREHLDLDSKSKAIIAGIASMKMWNECWKCANQDNDDLVPRP